jgi:hypothetical protein
VIDAEKKFSSSRRERSTTISNCLDDELDDQLDDELESQEELEDQRRLVDCF